MTTLNKYLRQKREALLDRRARVKTGELSAVTLKASASAEGRSGVRRIRIRDFQVVSDSPPDFAGYNLGPSSPELLLGALSSSLTHTFLIHASDQGVPLESLHAPRSIRAPVRKDMTIFPSIPRTSVTSSRWSLPQAPPTSPDCRRPWKNSARSSIS